MTLLDSEKGGEYIVEKLELAPNVEHHFEILGMTSGVKIKVMNRKKSGSVIFKLRGIRYAVGREFSGGIYIRRCNS